MTTEITLDEYRQLVKATPKYGNKSGVEVDGYIFDSKAESERYKELRLMLHAGTIHALRVHPEYELQPAFEHDGKKERAIVYEADFAYEENGTQIAEDVKGTKTAVFVLKAKLFRFRYPDIELRLIEV